MVACGYLYNNYVVRFSLCCACLVAFFVFAIIKRDIWIGFLKKKYKNEK